MAGYKDLSAGRSDLRVDEVVKCKTVRGEADKVVKPVDRTAGDQGAKDKRILPRKRMANIEILIHVHKQSEAEIR